MNQMVFFARIDMKTIEPAYVMISDDFDFKQEIIYGLGNLAREYLILAKANNKTVDDLKYSSIMEFAEVSIRDNVFRVFPLDNNECKMLKAEILMNAFDIFISVAPESLK